MQLVKTNKGVIEMADNMDYFMWKSQKAWELAHRIIPPQPSTGGAWTQEHYLEKAQQELEKAYEIINTVFANTLLSI